MSRSFLICPRPWEGGCFDLFLRNFTKFSWFQFFETSKLVFLEFSWCLSLRSALASSTPESRSLLVFLFIWWSLTIQESENAFVFRFPVVLDLLIFLILSSFFLSGFRNLIDGSCFLLKLFFKFLNAFKLLFALAL